MQLVGVIQPVPPGSLNISAYLSTACCFSFCAHSSTTPFNPFPAQFMNTALSNAGNQALSSGFRKVAFFPQLFYKKGMVFSSHHPKSPTMRVLDVIFALYLLSWSHFYFLLWGSTRWEYPLNPPLTLTTSTNVYIVTFLGSTFPEMLHITIVSVKWHSTQHTINRLTKEWIGDFIHEVTNKS